MAQTFTLADLLQAMMDARLGELFTSQPGIVASYDPTTGIAAVQPAVAELYDDERGDQLADQQPVITHVPVMFPGFGPWRITFPVAKGDTCLLVTSSVSLAEWLPNGGLVQPKSGHRNHISDTVAVVGLRDLKHKIKGTGSGTPTNAMSLGYDGGATIEIDQNFVNVGGVGGELALKGESFKSAMDTFVDALDTAIAAMADSPSQVASATTLHTAALGFKSALASALASIAKVK